MSFFFIYLAMFTLLEACTPTNPPTQRTPPAAATTSATNTPVITTTTEAMSMPRKREAKEVVVTVVTNLSYSPERNDFHFRTFMDLIKDYAEFKGVEYNTDRVQETVINKDGNFAVVFTIRGTECSPVSEFVREASAGVDFVLSAKVECE